MEKLVLFQKNDRFVFTRKREVEEMDAGDLLNNLKNVRKQMNDMEVSMAEFKRDIEVMEKFESTAKKIREAELEQAKKDRGI